MPLQLVCILNSQFFSTCSHRNKIKSNPNDKISVNQKILDSIAMQQATQFRHTINVSITMLGRKGFDSIMTEY